MHIAQDAPAIEHLIKSYPEFVKVESLPSEGETKEDKVDRKCQGLVVINFPRLLGFTRCHCVTFSTIKVYCLSSLRLFYVKGFEKRDHFANTKTECITT